MPVQLVHPLDSLVFDEIDVRLRAVCAPFHALCVRAKAERDALSEEGAPLPVTAQVNAILWRLPTLECSELETYEEHGSAMKATRAAFVAALHAADEAAHAYAASIADVIVADAVGQVAALAESTDAALCRATPPPCYATPPERIGGVFSVTL